MPKLCCLGLGVTALTLADRLLRQGWSIAGTCRSETKAAALRERGIEAIVAAGPWALPDGTTHLLSSIPPDESGDPGLALAGAAINPGLAWIGYLSATSVYGDRQGGWVDEATPANPSGPRGQQRLNAERGWQALSPSAHIFRLAGLYGPGRSALDTVRAGRAQRIDKPGIVFSRIHTDDVATILAASITQPNAGAIYNVADDEPAAPAEVIEYACRLLGIEPPPLIPFDQATLSPMAQSFYADSKRVGNRRIKEELGVKLAFPTYREGLKALLDGGF
jgi:nucleoside-diphosphate-sugar epimerase